MYTLNTMDQSIISLDDYWFIYPRANQINGYEMYY